MCWHDPGVARFDGGFGAWEEKTGAAGSRYDVLRDGRVAPVPEVYAGVRADECAQLMVDS